MSSLFSREELRQVEIAFEMIIPGSPAVVAIAQVLGVRPATVYRWKSGESAPSGRSKEAWLLLKRTVEGFKNKNHLATELLYALIKRPVGAGAPLNRSQILELIGYGWLNQDNSEEDSSNSFPSENGEKFSQNKPDFIGSWVGERYLYQFEKQNCRFSMQVKYDEEDLAEKSPPKISFEGSWRLNETSNNSFELELIVDNLPNMKPFKYPIEDFKLNVITVLDENNKYRKWERVTD